MKGKVWGRTLAVLLVILLAGSMFSSVKTEAKELQALKVPTIKVKVSGNSVKITINKTKDAEGYEIGAFFENELSRDDDTIYYGHSTAVSTGMFENGEEIEWNLLADRNHFEYFTLKKDGKKKRTVTINFPAGKLTVKVRSYNEKKYGLKRYSEYSKEKTITIKDTSIGYKTEYDFSKVKKGDIIKFGAYEQDNDYTNGKEAIQWIVLEKTKKSMLVISKYALDRLPYNTNGKTTWEKCTLRKWLNEKFYSKAFNKTEQGLIKTVTLENFDNPYKNTPGGNDTKDKVFLLSLFDMRNSDYGFSDEYGTYDENRRCAPTAYTKIHTYSYNKTKDGEDACYWWLRSPGYYANDAAYVHSGGNVDYGDGTYLSLCVGDSDTVDDFRYNAIGVRPALYIKLNP